MNVADCPHCGDPCQLKYGTLNGSDFSIEGWQAMCDRCGYSGPACKTEEEAVRAHNKISQNCGAV